MTFGVRMAPDSNPGKWAKPQRRFFKRGAGTNFRKIQSIKFLLTRDRTAVVKFLAAKYPFEFSRRQRFRLLKDFINITNNMRGYHTLAEILTVCDRIFRRGNGKDIVVVEAGSGSGSSTAKLSLATQIVGGRLLVYDSFRGIPQNDEQHELLDGRSLQFLRGAFKGRITAVKKRVNEYGAPEVCTYTKGLFQDTLIDFDEAVDVLLVDVDLISSTQTCIEQIVPNLKAHGVVFSQDGHLRATVDLFKDENFWREKLKIAPPRIPGLGTNKFLELIF